MSHLLTRPDFYFHIGSFPEPRIIAVPVSGTPSFLHDVRALFISDVHLRKSVPEEKLGALIKTIRNQNADILFLGGDYGEGQDQCERFLRALRSLSFRYGIYACGGNNDSFWKDSLIHCPDIVYLENQETRLELNGGPVEIAGCDDYMHGTPRTGDLFRNGSDAYRILLSHFPVVPDCKCDLVLSGHTHAGQINVFGFTPYTLRFEREHPIVAVRGQCTDNRTQYVISSGIGTSKLPIRIGCAPAIYTLCFT